MSVTQLPSGAWQARVYNKHTSRRITRTFHDQPQAGAAGRTIGRQDAVAWHDQLKREIADGGYTVRSVSDRHAEPPIPLNAAFAQWIDQAQRAIIRAKGGAEYKPSVLSQYSSAWRSHVGPWLGAYPVGTLQRRNIQAMVDFKVAQGAAPSTVRNAVTCLRAVLRWCIREELIDHNPAKDVELPQGARPRDKIVDAATAQRLVWDLDDDFGLRKIASEIYNLAFFCGLRRGELMALRRCDAVWDGARWWIDVVQSYDPRTQTFGKPKSKAGTRRVGVPAVARPLLLSALNRNMPDEADYLLFGQDGRPFNAARIADVAREVWGEEYIGLHEARHTYASMLIDAGVNIKTISAWMGHASVSITLDRYGHLMPGAGDAALEALDRYLG